MLSPSLSDLTIMLLPFFPFLFLHIFSLLRGNLFYSTIIWMNLQKGLTKNWWNIFLTTTILKLINSTDSNVESLTDAIRILVDYNGGIDD
jgi:hypothetical protein